MTAPFASAPQFILRELDRVGLGRNTFTSTAIDLAVRSADDVLRHARNLCVGSLIETVRSAKKTFDIDDVNRVLMQPRWQKETVIKDYGQGTSWFHTTCCADFATTY